MKSLIVYDSWFDNTRRIAEALASGINSDVHIIRVDDDPNRFLDGCELLIVGSPTHGGVSTPAIQEFLESIKVGDLEGIAVAAFDTRAPQKWLKVIGFAAPRIAKQLQHKGGALVGSPEGFYVHGKEGPLVDGEIARAKQWAIGLTKRVKQGVMT